MASDFNQTLSDVLMDECLAITEQTLFNWDDYDILTQPADNSPTFTYQVTEDYRPVEWNYDLQLATTDTTLAFNGTRFGLHGVASTDIEISPL